MNFQTYLLCFLAAVLGIAFHVLAIKIPSTKQRATVANMVFSYSAFFRDELAAILASFIAVMIYLIVLGELVTYKPAIEPYILALSVTVGFMGSSLLIAILGQASAKINAIVDVKSNQADGIVKPPDTPATV